MALPEAVPIQLPAVVLAGWQQAHPEVGTRSVSPLSVLWSACGSHLQLQVLPPSSCVQLRWVQPQPFPFGPPKSLGRRGGVWVTRPTLHLFWCWGTKLCVASPRELGQG